MTIKDLTAKQQALVDAAKTAERALTADEQREFDEYQRQIDELKATQSADAAAQTATEEERSRVTAINDMCRDFDVDASKFIADGTSVDATRAAILDEMKKRRAPATSGVRIEEGDMNNFRAAAIDALQIRAGVAVENPAEGAESMRDMSLRDIAIECLVREGVCTERSARTMGKDALYDTLCRQYFSPTAVFPAILDATIKKNIVKLYNEVPTTFQMWTTKGSLTDFKQTPDHNYVIGGGSFELVPENGELKQSRPSTELLPSRKLDTYGTQFTMSRQAFINDDIGFLAQVPGVYAAAAKRKINKQVYELIYNNNQPIYDGKVLFAADHGNLVTTGAAPSLTTINALMLKMQAQKDPFGEAINVAPRMLVLPIGYGLDVDTILHSTSIKTTDNDYTGYNPLANKGLTYVEDATLNGLAGNNAAPWFMVANPLTAKSVQVDYLNGNEVPEIRRSTVPGQLGFVWDIFLDWGITVIDYRGIARNNGVAISI